MNRVNLLDNLITLINSDCLEILPKVKPSCVAMVFADLPYGTTACKWDSIIPLDRLWPMLNSCCNINAAMCFSASIPFTITLGASNLDNLRYEWIWRKNRATLFQHANKMPMKKHENILVFYRKPPTYNPQFSTGVPYTDNRTERKRMQGLMVGGAETKKLPIVNDGTRYPTSDLEIDAEVNRKHLHPTQKPVELLEYLIKTYTNENDVVLDPTAGSFTTAVACINTNRRCIAIEKDADYFRIGVKRCEDAINARQ